MARNIKILLIVFLAFIGSQSFCQLLDSSQLSITYEFRTLEEAMQNPDSVFILTLKKQKIESFPEEIFMFKNVQKLDLSKNKIQLIPRNIEQLQKLEYLNIAKNKLETIPPEIGKLKNLKDLIIFQNEIAYLPSEIGEAENLELLDMWGNELESLPNEISKLKNLVIMDLRVIEISNDKQKQFQQLLPNTKIYFSNSCNCGG